MNRRDFLKRLGAGTAAVGMAAVIKSKTNVFTRDSKTNNSVQMTFRSNTSTGDKISILGFGMMRLPKVPGADRRSRDYDQEQIDKLVDYAIEHGVNYFDTAPVYCDGLSEKLTGNALRRHPRNKFFVATKLSNFSRGNVSFEESKQMYQNSMKNLQVDYIDYYLLHGLGQSMNDLNSRFVDNGILDFLVEERKAGRVRNLGFSFHGQKEVFDKAMELHEKYHWDFVQIQMNYVDWKHAKTNGRGNINAEYLYNELSKRNISVVIMEPLLGGRLAKLPGETAKLLKQADSESSLASWAFRFCGTYPNVLTALSGMTYMEHLTDNIKTFSPLKPLNENEMELLEQVTSEMIKYKHVPCTTCRYCVPCPYKVEIPDVFLAYNKVLDDKQAPLNKRDADFENKRQNFILNSKEQVGRLKNAFDCTDCEECLSKCPQGIQIPTRMAEITGFIRQLNIES